MAVEDDLKTIRERSAAITTRKTRAEVEVENATKRRTAARTALKEEFGITKSEDAKTTLTQLRQDLETALSNATTKLEEAGA